jgi:hypothetical protein
MTSRGLTSAPETPGVQVEKASVATSQGLDTAPARTPACRTPRRQAIPNVMIDYPKPRNLATG